MIKLTYPPHNYKPLEKTVYKRVSTCDNCGDMTDGFYEEGLWKCAKCRYAYGLAPDQYSRVPLP